MSHTLTRAVCLSSGMSLLGCLAGKEATLLQLRLSNDKLAKIRPKEMLEPGDYP